MVKEQTSNVHVFAVTNNTLKKKGGIKHTCIYYCASQMTVVPTEDKHSNARQSVSQGTERIVHRVSVETRRESFSGASFTDFY